MDFDKLSTLFKERDELKDIQHQINDDKCTLALWCKYSSGGYMSKVLEDSYKSILNNAINTKLSDVEYKIEEVLRKSLV